MTEPPAHIRPSVLMLTAFGPVRIGRFEYRLDPEPTEDVRQWARSHFLRVLRRAVYPEAKG